MHDLPVDIRAVVDRLATEPLSTPTALRTRIDRFAGRLDQSEEIHAFADRHLATRIAAGCRTLLADPANHVPARLRLVQLAVDYLILEDDAESERHSVLGFDDDALVFDHYAAKLGRTDLQLGGSHT